MTNDFEFHTDSELEKELKVMEDVKEVNENQKKEFEDTRHKRLLKSIFVLCDLAGFKIENRVVLRDKKTGKVWR